MQTYRFLSVLAAAAMICGGIPRHSSAQRQAIAGQDTKASAALDEPPSPQWSNAATVAPGWRSQYPLSAQTTQVNPSVSSNAPLGLNTTSGLTSNGADVFVAEGMLMRIDSVGRRLWIQTSAEKELEFQYSRATQIRGTASRAEALASARGSYLRIRFVRQEGRDNAVQIEHVPGSIWDSSRSWHSSE